MPARLGRIGQCRDSSLPFFEFMVPLPVGYSSRRGTELRESCTPIPGFRFQASGQRKNPCPCGTGSVGTRLLRPIKSKAFGTTSAFIRMEITSMTPTYGLPQWPTLSGSSFQIRVPRAKLSDLEVRSTKQLCGQTQRLESSQWLMRSGARLMRVAQYRRSISS